MKFLIRKFHIFKEILIISRQIEKTRQFLWKILSRNVQHFSWKMWKFSNLWKTWMKSSWWKRSISVVLEWFEVVLVSIHFSNFQQNFRPRKFRPISRKKFKQCWNWRQRNFIFRGFYMVDYLSNSHEKLTVRKVKSCTFQHVLQSCRRTLCAGPVSKNN